MKRSRREEKKNNNHSNSNIHHHFPYQTHTRVRWCDRSQPAAMYEINSYSSWLVKALYLFSVWSSRSGKHKLQNFSLVFRVWLPYFFLYDYWFGRRLKIFTLNDYPIVRLCWLYTVCEFTINSQFMEIIKLIFIPWRHMWMSVQAVNFCQFLPSQSLIFEW